MVRKRGITRLLSLFLAVLMVVALSGCGKSVEIGDEFPDASVQFHPVSSLRQDIEKCPDDDSLCSLNIAGLSSDGGVVWTYESPYCEITDAGAFELLGNLDGVIYLSEQRIYNGTDANVNNCRIRALNADTGETLWDNYDYYGTQSSYDWDYNTGIFYIAGGNRPDCMAIAPDGSTLWCIERVSDTLSDITGLELTDDCIILTFANNTDKPVSKTTKVKISYDGKILTK